MRHATLVFMFFFGMPALHGWASDRPLERNRFVYSRQIQTDAQGFYFQPAGLCDDYPEESTTVAKIRNDFRVLRDTGSKVLRFGIGWDSIEEEPGKYNWRFWDQLVAIAKEEQITLLPYVAYTPKWANSSEADFWRTPPDDLSRFGRFMNVIVNRYKGSIKSWELWNEPDLKNYWLGTPAQLAKMLIEGARQVRAADPDAVLVLGGMAHGASPFYRELIEKHRLADYFDVVNVHGYNETWQQARAEEYPSQLREFEAVSKPKNKKLPRSDVWLAEFGYSNWRYKANKASEWGIDVIYDYEHTPQYQAVALFKHHVLALAAGNLSLTAWYRINDLVPNEAVIGDNNNKYLGVLTPQGDPKPAIKALKLYNSLFGEPVRKLPESKIRVRKPARSQSVVHAFEQKDGEVVVVAWLRSSRRDEVIDRSGLAKDKRQETVNIDLSGYDLTQTTRFLLDGSAAPSSLRNIKLRGDTVFIASVKPQKAPTVDAPID